MPKVTAPTLSPRTHYMRKAWGEFFENIPSGGKFYLTIDADGVDPSIMPAVMSQTPGGLTWPQLHTPIHELTRKGTLVGMDLVRLLQEMWAARQ